jgi:16S rRNA (guanine527-N7)-methyltransferase
MSKTDFPLLRAYFPDFPDTVFEQFRIARDLWQEWNGKVNLVSRKDLEFLEEKHILHSLVIPRLFRFPSGTRFLDVGTGGGFPGIPLAIALPDCQVVMIDSIGKKIQVVNEIIQAAGILNASAGVSRSEDFSTEADFIVSRAVTRMKPFISQTAHLLDKNRNNSSRAGDCPRKGYLYLKGGDPQGDLGVELKETGKAYSLYPIKELFTESFFDTKFLVHIPYP